MKKFGLKAIAGSLALMLAASLVVPATAAAEEKVLLTTKAENVLVITQDMVDEDGEIVLSGENFDKVVLPNDVEIDGLYIDNCEIGEFTVEGGNDPAVELWDVKIGTVLVAAPTLLDENQAITEYLDLMKGKERTKEFDIDGFVKDVQNTNKRLTSMVPKLSLKGADMVGSTQTIGAIKLAGNVNIDLGEGKLPGELTVLFKSAQEKMDVTVSNYEGSLNVFQTSTEGSQFGIVNVKLKNCKIGNANVNSDGNANVALRSADSTIVKVNYNARNEGAGVLTLATPADILNVEPTAVNATVKLISPIVNADVKGERIDLNIGPKSSVQHATIAGTNNRVTGTSALKECVIPEGHTASIEVAGAKIDGDNVYSPRISLDPGERPMRPEEPSDIELVPMQPETVSVNGNKAAITGQYQTAIYYVPDEIKDKVASVKITVSSDSQLCIKVMSADGSTILNDLSGYGGDFFNDSATSMTKVTKTYRVSEAISEIHFMSCKADGTTNVTVHDIEFTEASGDGEEEQSDIVLEALYGDSGVAVDGNKATITGAYKTAAYTVPADIKNKVTSVTVEVSSDDQLCVKVVGADGQTALNNLNGWGGDDFNSGVGTMTKVTKVYEVTAPISRIDFMSCLDSELNIEVHDIQFTVAEGEEEVTVTPITVKAGDCWWWNDNSGGANPDEIAAAEDKSVTNTINGTYNEWKFQIPGNVSVDLSTYTKAVVEFETNSEVGVKIWPADDDRKMHPEGGYPVELKCQESNGGTVEIDLLTGWNELYADVDANTLNVANVGFMVLGDSATVTFKSVTFK